MELRHLHKSRSEWSQRSSRVVLAEQMPDPRVPRILVPDQLRSTRGAYRSRKMALYQRSPILHFWRQFHMRGSCKFWKLGNSQIFENKTISLGPRLPLCCPIWPPTYPDMVARERLPLGRRCFSTSDPWRPLTCAEMGFREWIFPC
jgi:hypothetical protein